MSFLAYLFCFTILAFHLHELVESAPLSILTDKQALISFKSQITQDTENPLSSWHESSLPCNWTGVTCNKNANRVIGLNLSGFRLTGTITPTIGNLTFLRSIQLQNNQLRGSVPDQITNLFRLRVLNMSFNSLDGVIPSNTSNLINLEVLDLMANKITGQVPYELGNLKNLKILNLRQNNLLGSLPQSISNLSSLTTLNLGTNSLSGQIPSDMDRLINLQHLDLTINSFSGVVPPSIYNISSLVSLALASNNLYGEIPYDVGLRLPNLLVFNFCFNKFTGGIPGSLHNLTNIQVIRMAHNLLEGTVPPGLGNLPFLQMYNIGFNKIASSNLDFITSLTNSTRLNFLAFDGNLFEGVIPDSIGNLSRGSLQKLYMGGNRFSGNIPLSISQLSSLTLLNMSYNSFSGEIPPEIGNLKELQELNFAGNQLSGSIPNSFGNLEKLNLIDLSGNRFTGEIPSSFGNLTNLLSMDVSNNRINGSIPKEIFSLPSLSTILNISRNILTGPIPEFRQLGSVVTIDLSDNRLSGNISNSIENCKSLEQLSMARNLLTGHIPDSLAELKGLVILDLSSNQLSGSIPTDLQNLQALKLLNLSSNLLEGEIPSGGIFKNLSGVHLEGNSKLCSKDSCRKTRADRVKLARILFIVSLMVAAFVFLVIFVCILLKKNKAKRIATSDSFTDKHLTISYDEIRRGTDNFDKVNLVGKGSFGSVYKMYHKGVLIAVKIFDIERTGYLKSFLAECLALKDVRHRNLVKLITSCSSLDFKNNEFLALVYEFMSNGNLDDWIKRRKTKENGEGLNLVERLNVVIDVACALDYLHNDCEAAVVHCDLKPSNILLDQEMNAKVGDFGLARLLMDRTSVDASVTATNGLKGSIGYIPPEYGFGKKASTAGDVYSFGVMLLELFTGKNPTHESFVGEVNLVKWVDSFYPNKLNQVLDPSLMGHHKTQDWLIKVIGVGLSCTASSPDRRIGIRDVLGNLRVARDTLSKTSMDETVCLEV